MRARTTAQIICGLFIVISLHAQSETPVPLTPDQKEEEILKVIKSYSLDRIAYSYKQSEDMKTASVEEGLKILRKKPAFRAPFVEKLLTFVEAYPDNPTALMAAGFVLIENPELDEPQEISVIYPALTKYIDHPELPLIMNSAWIENRGMEAFLRKVVDTTTKKPNRGAAAYYLSQIVSGERDKVKYLRMVIQDLRNYSPEALLPAKEIEKIEKISTELGSDIDLFDPLLLRAERELFEIENLSIGMTAPEIIGNDAYGISFKLSDYRGKVVVLAFWKHKERGCQADYKDYSSLVSKLNDKPFALIGVNCDTAGKLSEANKEERLNWRSFANDESGKSPIAKAWVVRKIPTVYVLDENGVIRAKDPKLDQLEKIVTDLINERGESSTR